eukprot:521465_1
MSRPHIDKNYSKPIHSTLANCCQHEIPDLIVDALENIGFDFINHKYRNEILISLLKKKLKHLDLKVGKRMVQKEFISKLKRIGITENVAVNVFSALRMEDNDRIYHMNKDKKVKYQIVRLLLAELNKKSNDIKLNEIVSIRDQKFIFASKFKQQLSRFYYPISDPSVTKDDLIKIAATIKVFDNKTKQKLCNYLFEKLLSDIESIKPWECQQCLFMNRRMMVGGLWRLYPQLSECGLCGVQRGKNKLNMFDIKSSNIKNEKADLDRIYGKSLCLPKILINDWNRIKDIKCNYKQDIKSKQIYLEKCNVFDMKKMVEKVMNTVSNDTKYKYKRQLQNNKEYILNLILNWIDSHQIDGNSFVMIRNGKAFANLVKESIDKQKYKKIKLLLILKDMYNNIMKNIIHCGAMKRVCCILNHYNKLTEKLISEDDRYPYEIKQFLNRLNGYDAIKFLNDID